VVPAKIVQQAGGDYQLEYQSRFTGNIRVLIVISARCLSVCRRNSVYARFAVAVCSIFLTVISSLNETAVVKIFIGSGVEFLSVLFV